MAVNEDRGIADQQSDGRQNDTGGRAEGNARQQNSRGSGRSNRGFASMDPAKQREIASKGGRAAHEKGTAHEWTSDEAREAGRKGGEIVSRDRAHMSAIGREGGEARGAGRRAAESRQGRDTEARGPSVVRNADTRATSGGAATSTSRDQQGGRNVETANPSSSREESSRGV